MKRRDCLKLVGIACVAPSLLKYAPKAHDKPIKWRRWAALPPDVPAQWIEITYSRRGISKIKYDDGRCSYAPDAKKVIKWKFYGGGSWSDFDEWAKQLNRRGSIYSSVS